MEINSFTVTTPPLPAATVMMLRDTEQGMEVFLLKRHGLSDVLGGAYVFPGGKVDPGDTLLDMDAHLDQRLPDLHQALDEDDIDTLTAAGLYVAAVREVFEESGVLFAHRNSRREPGQTPSAETSGDTAADSPWLSATSAGEAFDGLLAQHGLRLHTQALQPWSRWVTPTVPSMMRKRFDTRFFVAIAPSHQTARHDNRETVESVWLAPRAALEQYWRGDIELAPPQIMSLAHLSRYGSAQEAMNAARQRKPAVIRPEPFDMEGTRVLCYPGDPLHSVQERALPGPTRLYYRNKRFEPATGFEALFG